MSKRVWAYFLIGLLVVTALFWLAVFERPFHHLRIVACDVGQGDAILITQGSFQMLVDGGPGKKVISCLGKHIPFWDRKIEVVALTHPDTDHSTGLVEVFRNYEVQTFVTTEINHESQAFETLKSFVSQNDIKTVFARSGDKFSFDKVYFEILSPSNDMFERATGFQPNVLGSFTSKDTNNYSVVMKVSYKQFDALLTGDIETRMSDLLSAKYDLSDINYLKVPHHGSKNGLSKKLLDEVNPDVSVISVGKSNRYGHPHEDILKILREKVVQILRTDEKGDIVTSTDGYVWW